MNSRLTALMQSEPVPPLAEIDAHRMVAIAQEKAIQHKRTKRTAWMAAAAVFVCASAVGSAFYEPAPSVTHLSLPSGDQLHALSGAAYSVGGEENRYVHLNGGGVLFDVQPLREGESFEVRAGDAHVRVRGTVFSVTVENGQTSVRVYEGAVDVSIEGRRLRLREGEMWQANGRFAAHARTPSALDTLGEQAALRRAAVKEQPAPSQPTRDELPTDDGASESVTAAAPGPALRPEIADVATPPSREAVRQWMAAGEFERVWVEARRRGWQLLEADALRAGERYDEAVVIYERLGARDSVAALDAARIHFHHRSDPAGALRALDLAPRTEPMQERLAALRMRALDRLGRPIEAEAAANAYIEAFPQGGASDAAARILAGLREPPQW